VPALRASKLDLVGEIKEGTADVAGGARVFGLRNVLVVVQLAVSLVALVTAGLFVRSLDVTLRIDPGFDAARLGTFTLDLGSNGYDEAGGREFQRRMVERVSGLAGVESAALANWAPLIGGGFARTVFLDGQDTSDPSNGRLAQIQVVGETYHRTMGIRLIRGRAFLPSDQPTSPLVVIISEAMARRFWPGQDPIGRRFRFFGNPAPVEVIGLAADSAFDTVDGNRDPLVWEPLNQVYSPTISLMIRAGRPSAALATARREVQQLDRQLPILFVTTMSDAIRQSLFLRRFGAGILMAFGLLALVLSLVGVYGVMAYAVGRRTRELGIRMALGASPKVLVRGVVVQGARLAVVGAVAGLVLALALGRAIGALLYGVGAADPATFIAVPVALAAGVVVASYLPARRAARIDPLSALRHE
jgi:predicted permease